MSDNNNKEENVNKTTRDIVTQRLNTGKQVTADDVKIIRKIAEELQP